MSIYGVQIWTAWNTHTGILQIHKVPKRKTDHKIIIKTNQSTTHACASRSTRFLKVAEKRSV